MKKYCALLFQGFTVRETSKWGERSVYGKKSFLSKESDTYRSYKVYTLPTMQASPALIQTESGESVERHWIMHIQSAG